MAFTETLSQFFRTADFAVAATWSVGPATVNVIFDREYVEQFGIVAGTGPVALAELATMPTVAPAQTLTINAVVYTITGVEPDGTGLVVLRLRIA